MLDVERVELFDAHDRDLFVLQFVAPPGQVVVHLARAQQHARHLRAGFLRRHPGVVDDFLECAVRQILHAAHARGVAEQALGRHHDQRLAEPVQHLAAEHVEVLRGRRGIAHLDVVPPAELEEPLQTRRGVLRSLPLVPVGEQAHKARPPVPLRLGAGDVLIDDHLRAVAEVPELRFPDHQHVGRREGEPVLEAQHRVLRERRVVDAVLRLTDPAFLVDRARVVVRPGHAHLADVVERDVRLARVVIPDHRVAVAERPASAVLPGERVIVP